MPVTEVELSFRTYKEVPVSMSARTFGQFYKRDLIDLEKVEDVAKSECGDRSVAPLHVFDCGALHAAQVTYLVAEPERYTIQGFETSSSGLSMTVHKAFAVLFGTTVLTVIVVANWRVAIIVFAFASGFAPRGSGRARDR